MVKDKFNKSIFLLFKVFFIFIFLITPFYQVFASKTSDLAESKKIETEINKLLGQKTQFPPYLLNVNSFDMAVNTVWSNFTSWATQSHLTSQYEEYYNMGMEYENLRVSALINAKKLAKSGDNANAKKFLTSSKRFASASVISFESANNYIFFGNIDAGEKLAEGIREGCAKAVKTGVGIYYPAYASKVDYAYTLVDYAIDRALLKKNYATKKLVVNLLTSPFLEKIKFDSLGKKTIADYTKKKTGKLIFPELEKLLTNTQAQLFFSRALKNSATNLEDKAIKQIITSLGEAANGMVETNAQQKLLKKSAVDSVSKIINPITFGETNNKKDSTKTYLENLEKSQNLGSTDLLESGTIKSSGLMSMSVSDLNTLAQKSPQEMAARLKGESADVIEYISKNTSVIYYVAYGGYAKEVVTGSLGKVNLKNMKVSDLDTLAQKSPQEMAARLKGESADVIEYISKNTSVIYYVAYGGYAKEVVAGSLGKVNLKNMKVSDLDTLAQKSPQEMAARLKGESADVIEYISKNTSVIYYVAYGGYAKEVVTGSLGKVNLKNMKVSDLDTLAQKSPQEMAARLKGESADVIEYISKNTSVIYYITSAGYTM